MSDIFREAGGPAISLVLLNQDNLEAYRSSVAPRVRTWIAANGFNGSPGQILTIPDLDGGIESVLFGINGRDEIYALAGAPQALQPGVYQIAETLTPEAATRLALGWGLGSYRFDRYRNSGRAPASLVWPAEADRSRVLRELAAITLVRDLVNTPANDMGPAALTEAARAVARDHGALFYVTTGDDLLAANFPTVHAVGRAAAEPPSIVDIKWGQAGMPRVALVGKGITFDTGGLDLKTGSSMGLMKKDMGGAAHALALGHMIMAAGLPIRLRVLLAVAENAVGPNANRPGDVVTTRSGITVEIGNTDAEGRLVLADMLTTACEDEPELIIDFATLTGAARVALGPDLPALFATDRLAGDILQAAQDCDDPLWRLPLWQPYRRNLDSKIANLNNIAPNSFAGAIYGALFLQDFVKGGVEWAHLDLYAWNPTARPGRPVGGEAFAIRGLFEMLARRYGR